MKLGEDVSVKPQVLRFESELYHAKKLSTTLLAATLILSNKLIDKERLRQIWEEIKMLDILEIAKEEGIKEGKALGLQEGLQEGKALGLQEGLQEGKALGLQEGLQEGKALGLQEGLQEGKALGELEASREMVVEALIDRFEVVSVRILERIKALQSQDALKVLFHQALKCQSLQEFEAVLEQVM